MYKAKSGQKLSCCMWTAATGLLKTGDAANLTAYVSIDDGAVTALTDTSATEDSAANAPGFYTFDLTAAETNGNKLKFTVKSATSGVTGLAVPPVVQTIPATPLLGFSEEGSIATAPGGNTFGLSFTDFDATLLDDAFPITLEAIDGTAAGQESQGTITGGIASLDTTMSLQVGDTVRIGPAKATVRNVTITTEIN